MGVWLGKNIYRGLETRMANFKVDLAIQETSLIQAELTERTQFWNGGQDEG